MMECEVDMLLVMLTRLKDAESSIIEHPSSPWEVRMGCIHWSHTARSDMPCCNITLVILQRIYVSMASCKMRCLLHTQIVVLFLPWVSLSSVR